MTREITSMGPIVQPMTTTIKKANPIMTPNTRKSTVNESVGSQVNTSIPMKPHTMLITIVYNKLLTTAVSASARTKGCAVCQALLAEQALARLRSSIKASHFRMYSRRVLAPASFAMFALKEIFVARTRPSTNHKFSPGVMSSWNHSVISLSQLRDGNRFPLPSNHRWNSSNQHGSSSQARLSGISVHMPRKARCAQGSLGSKLGSNLQVSS
mmetsp:Transcript_49898/g.96349  ORF Transcript_49898/g.96349 Transcript_49898/m.96349 type:complete len:212 (-) Transcript_49898:673-1308(-)